jgi:hypothetical protein
MRDEIAAFVDRYRDAAMITPSRGRYGPHGPRRARGGRRPDQNRRVPRSGAYPQSSRDNRCSLFVFGPHPWWLGLESEVSIVEGPDAAQELVRLLRARHAETTPPGMVMAHDDAIMGDRLYREADYIEHARKERLIALRLHRPAGLRQLSVGPRTARLQAVEQLGHRPHDP